MGSFWIDGDDAYEMGLREELAQKLALLEQEFAATEEETKREKTQAKIRQLKQEYEQLLGNLDDLIF